MKKLFILLLLAISFSCTQENVAPELTMGEKQKQEIEAIVKFKLTNFQFWYQGGWVDQSNNSPYIGCEAILTGGKIFSGGENDWEKEIFEVLQLDGDVYDYSISDDGQYLSFGGYKFKLTFMQNQGFVLSVDKRYVLVFKKI